MSADPMPSGESPEPQTNRAWLSNVWPVVLAVIYLALNTVMLLHTVKDPKLAEKMQVKDSRQYLEIATQFASGDFSMSYVREMPHRQPLYSLCLAPVIRLWGADLFKEGYVNVLVGLAMLFLVYFGMLRLFRSTIIAIVVSVLYIANPFMLDKTACRLMTEPLHILCLTALIFFFLAYLRHGRTIHIAAASFAAGLDYLARTNGLFVMGAMLATLGGYDLWRLIRPRAEENRKSASRLGLLVLRYAVALVAFAVAATPSWLPRYAYFRNPIYHGYLSNYMWVDNYEQAHTGQIKSDFTWKDYAKDHDLGGFIQRWGHGFYHVYYDVPRHTEHIRYLYLLFTIGVILAFAQRRWEYCLLFVFLFIQLIPVAWTIIANPGPRIAYGTTFPFELFYAGLVLSYLTPLLVRWAEARLPRPGPAAQS